MIKNPRRVKDLIRNKAQGDSTKAQTLQRHYAMERFLERISVSRYRDNFILKGGMLVSSMIGIDQRSTMDVDATMTGQTLSPANALRIVGEIAAIEPSKRAAVNAPCPPRPCHRTSVMKIPSR